MVEKKGRDRRVEVRMSVLGLEMEPPCKALGGGMEDKLACSLVCPPNRSLELRAEWVERSGPRINHLFKSGQREDNPGSHQRSNLWMAIYRRASPQDGPAAWSA